VSPSEHKTKKVLRAQNSKVSSELFRAKWIFQEINFIPQDSVIARPLINLLRQAKLEFSGKERESFMHLKEILCSDPILSLYVIGAETGLHTDA